MILGRGSDIDNCAACKCKEDAPFVPSYRRLLLSGARLGSIFTLLRSPPISRLMPTPPKKLRKQYANKNYPNVVLRFEDGHEIEVLKDLRLLRRRNDQGTGDV